MSKEQQDEYVLTEVRTYKNATVRVFRPILTEEERKRRYDRIEDALTEYARATYHLRDENGEIA